MLTMARASKSQWRAAYGFCRCVLGFLTYIHFICYITPGQAAGTTSTVTNSPPTAANTGNAASTIPFSSAVQLASSVSWQLSQLASIPVLPIPTNITAFPEYEIVSKLAPALPPIQAGATFPEAEKMIADLIASTNGSNPGSSLAGRQSVLRVMVVGDSMSQGTVTQSLGL